MKLSPELIKALKELALSSGEKHNLPNAALIVNKKGGIIGSSESLVATNTDATAHAERLVIEKVCKKEKSPLIPNYILLTVLEPCLMCLAAAYWAGIKKIYYIIPSSRYFSQIPWITESKNINKKNLVKKFAEPVVYQAIKSYQKEFEELFDKYINKVIKRNT